MIVQPVVLELSGVQFEMLLLAFSLAVVIKDGDSALTEELTRAAVSCMTEHSTESDTLSYLIYSTAVGRRKGEMQWVG